MFPIRHTYAGCARCIRSTRRWTAGLTDYKIDTMVSVTHLRAAHQRLVLFGSHPVRRLGPFVPREGAGRPRVCTAVASQTHPARCQTSEGRGTALVPNASPSHRVCCVQIGELADPESLKTLPEASETQLRRIRGRREIGRVVDAGK